MTSICHERGKNGMDCSGAGVARVDLPETAHGMQCCTHRSTLALTLGHQIVERHRCFILTIPGWPSCASPSARQQRLHGITIILSFINRPSLLRDNVSRTSKYDRSLTATAYLGSQPSVTRCSTACSSASLMVASCNS